MGILHSVHNKTSRSKGYAVEWNAEHIINSNFNVGGYQPLAMAIENRTDYPGGPAIGQIIFRTDLLELQIWSGTAWLTIAGINTADWIKNDGSVDFTANQSMDSHKIIDLATPTADYDAATKKYVDDSVVSPIRTDRGTAICNASGDATINFVTPFAALPVIVVTAEGSGNFAALTLTAIDKFSVHVTKMSTSTTSSSGTHTHSEAAHTHGVGTLANAAITTHTHTGPDHVHYIADGRDSKDYGCDFDLGSSCGSGTCVRNVVCGSFSRSNHNHEGSTGYGGNTASGNGAGTGTGGSHNHTLTLANGATAKINWIAMEV
jgi:hypothetical protein